MGTNRKRLVAAAASMVVAVGLAGCGGDSDDRLRARGQHRTRSAPTATKGGTVYSLELSVTQPLDPQRTYTGRDLSNMSRLVYRSLVNFPKGATDNDRRPDPDPGPGHRHRPVQRGRHGVVVHAQGRPEVAGRQAGHL